MRISYSQCACYQTCPHQYRLRFLDRVRVPLGPEVHFGAAVHEALRVMYSPRHATPPPVEEVVNAFVKAWAAREAQVAEAERQPYFEQGVRLLQRHCQRRVQRPQPGATAAVELPFSIPFDGDHRLTGRIDRVQALPDEGLEVIDYKTSRRMPPQPLVERDTQLAIYRMAADHLYPGRRVTTTFVYLLHDVEMRTTQTPELLAEKADEIREAILGIELGDFDPRPGPHCDWCDWRAHCTLYRAPQPPPNLAEVDIAGLLRDYAAADAEEKAAKDRRAALRQQILDYLDGSQAERVEAGGYLAERRRTRRVVSWQATRVREVLEPLGLWDRVTDVNTLAVRDLLKARQLPPDARRELEAAATYGETQILRVKPLSGLDEESDE